MNFKEFCGLLQCGKVSSILSTFRQSNLRVIYILEYMDFNNATGAMKPQKAYSVCPVKKYWLCKVEIIASLNGLDWKGP